MRNRLSALQTLGAAIWLNGALVPAALAAWDPQEMLAGQDVWELLLTGSLALLAIGIGLKLFMRTRRATEPVRPYTGSRYFGPQFFPSAESDGPATRVS